MRILGPEPPRLVLQPELGHDPRLVHVVCHANPEPEILILIFDLLLGEDFLASGQNLDQPGARVVAFRRGDVQAILSTLAPVKQNASAETTVGWVRLLFVLQFENSGKLVVSPALGLSLSFEEKGCPALEATQELLRAHLEPRVPDLGAQAPSRRNHPARESIEVPAPLRRTIRHGSLDRERPEIAPIGGEAPVIDSSGTPRVALARSGART